MLVEDQRALDGLQAPRVDERRMSLAVDAQALDAKAVEIASRLAEQAPAATRWDSAERSTSLSRLGRLTRVR